MKRLLSLAAVLSLSVLQLFAQQATEQAHEQSNNFCDSIFIEACVSGGLDLRVFGKYARDDQFFDNISRRFEQADTTLLLSDFLILYYGYGYRDEYKGGFIHKPWKELLNNYRYKKAYPMILEVLKSNPASPNLLYDALIAAEQINRPAEEQQRLIWRLHRILDCINLLGNGTKQLPYVVMSVLDESAILHNVIRIKNFKGHELVYIDELPYAKLMFSPADNSSFSGTEAWFDVYFPIHQTASPKHVAMKLLVPENEKN